MSQNADPTSASSSEAFTFLPIAPTLIRWYQQYGRELPWRQTRDPYPIWIAEIILQQTRIDQGIAYYHRFLEAFPDLDTLASASQDEVLKLWEGLGYYTRARNLHAAARQLVRDYRSRFPEDYRELEKLKGIGPYTARAIGSFAFANPVGVVDGNVLRVMSRLLADPSPINKQKVKRKFQHIIDSWVQGHSSRDFNNAIMDLGSMVCTPRQPDCPACPLNEWCLAYQLEEVERFPVKEKKGPKPSRYFFFFIVENERGEIAIRQRAAKGLWGGLWEIPNREVEADHYLAAEPGAGKVFLGSIKHVLTHFDMHIAVFRVKANETEEEDDWKYISKDKISIFAFAKAVLKIFSRYLEQDKSDAGQ